MRKSLPQHDEISSTEKLLEAIRGESSSLTGASGASAGTGLSSVESRKSYMKRPISFRKRVVLGIEVTPSELRLVKVARSSEQRWKLLDLQRVALKTGISGKADFSKLLQSAVQDFAGSTKNVSLWGILPSTRVDIRHIRIPKVSKNQIFNAVYWSMKKETDFNEGDLFDFEVQEEIIDKGINKLGVLVYIVPGEEVLEIRDLFSESGLTLAGITLAPFVTQNLFRSGCIPVPNKSVANLHIENDFSRINIFSHGNLVATRVIKTGLSSMVDSLLESVSRLGVDSFAAVGGKISSAPSDLDRDEAQKLVLSLCSAVSHGPALNHESDEHATGRQKTEEEVLRAIGPAVERLVRQVERTFEHYARTSGSENVGKVYISGAIEGWNCFDSYVGEQLGLEQEVLDPLASGIHFQSEVLIPNSFPERLSYTTAFGLALSDNSGTPNLLFTYKDKQRFNSIRLINRGIAFAAIAVMSLLAGVFLWQSNVIRAKQTELAGLEQQLAQYNPILDQDMVVQMAAKTKTHLKTIREMSRDFLGVAVLNELSTLTPPNVRLISVTIDLPESSGESALADSGAPSEDRRALIVDGIIQGDRFILDASLARYLMGLGRSPIFVDPVVHSSVLESYQDEGEVLHFILKLGLV